MSTIREYALAGTASIAILCGIASGADATVLPFQISPAGLGDALNLPFTATDIQGTSDALVRQTGLFTQVETGWDLVTSMSNNGSPILAGTSGITVNYNIYLTYSATISGLQGFGAGQSGTVTAFTFSVFGDPGANSTFAAGTANSGGGIVPTVTPNGADVLLATGSLLSGSAGFAPTTGAPFLDVITTFNLTGAGSLVFTQPIPFYNIALTSTIPSQVGNITSDNGPPPNAEINGIVSDTTFTVPEPGSLALLGAALAGFGVFNRRRRRKAQA